MVMPMCGCFYPKNVDYVEENLVRLMKKQAPSAGAAKANLAGLWGVPSFG